MTFLAWSKPLQPMQVLTQYQPSRRNGALAGERHRAGHDGGVAKYRDDIGGTLVAAGTASAYTITTNQVVTNPPPAGFAIRFRVTVANNAGATLAVDGGTAFALDAQTGGTLGAIAAAYLVPFGTYDATFDGTSAWILANSYSTPSTGIIAPIWQHHAICGGWRSKRKFLDLRRQITCEGNLLILFTTVWGSARQFLVPLMDRILICLTCAGAL